MKPLVLYTNPAAWRRFGSGSMDLRYIPLTGDVPRKKTGAPAPPNAPLTLATKDGIEHLVKAMRKHKPQVFFRGVNTGMSMVTHERIREASPKTVIIVADGNESSTMSAHARRCGSDLVDMFLLNSAEPSVFKCYEEAGLKVGTLYDAVAPDDHPPPTILTPYDCFFGGSNRRRKVARRGVLPGTDIKREGVEWVWDFPGGKFRFDLMSTIHRKFNLLLVGPGKEWPFKVGGVLRYPRYFRAFHKAKIAVGCNQYELRRYYTRRLFHGGVSGRMYLTRYIPGMEEDFENHKHLVWFNTIDEAVMEIERYLVDDNAREAIAVNGRRLFLEKHTWKARLKEFERIVKRVV